MHWERYVVLEVPQARITSAVTKIMHQVNQPQHSCATLLLCNTLLLNK
jgi:hypothetical protein